MPHVLTPLGAHRAGGDWDAREGESAAQLTLEKEYIGVPASVLELRLRDFKQAITKRSAWLGPAGAVLGFVSTLVTLKATPNDFSLWGYSRDAWIIGTHVLLTFCGGWTLFLGGRALGSCFARPGSSTVEYVIERLRPSAPTRWQGLCGRLWAGICDLLDILGNA